ncbi:hypothetical protein [Paenibacillus sp. FSL H3-0333]|uniref:hypothetical protein n=1 Tax=Paenibacillus sp. FSL H3-0333 TaxID=2921373 RepID=UPI0030F94016
MKLDEFSKLSTNLEAYTAQDVLNFQLMTEEELDDYQRDIEFNDGDNITPWDHMRAVITFRKIIRDQIK